MNKLLDKIKEIQNENPNLRTYLGASKGKEEFYENNRMASFRVFDEQPILVELSDSEEVQYIIFENPIMEKQVTLIVDSVFGGTKWNDTCITEIAFYE